MILQAVELIIFMTILYSVQAQEDFGLLISDAGGNVHLLNTDLSLKSSIDFGTQVCGIVVDPWSTVKSHRVVFSTIEPQGSTVRAFSLEHVQPDPQLDGLDTVTTTQLYSTNGTFIRRLVLEPISGNIYYTAVSSPKGSSFVGVLSPDNENKKLIEGLDEPTDIVLHHERRKLFYINHKSTEDGISHIGCSYLDGTANDILIDTDIVGPTGLAIDYNEDKLYWSDAWLHKIESYDLNTGNRSIWMQFPTDVTLMDILVDSDYLYYVQYTSPIVTKLRLSDRNLEAEMTSNSFTRLDALAVYSDPTRQLSGISGCSDRGGLGDCSNICLPSKENHVCACPDGQQILEDGTTCDNAQICPETFEYGNVVPACKRYHREICEFICNEGAYTTSETVTCENGQWNVSPSPCESEDDNYRLLVTDSTGYVYGIDTKGNVVQTFEILRQTDGVDLAEVVGVGISPHSTSTKSDFVYSTAEQFTYYDHVYNLNFVFRMRMNSSVSENLFNPTVWGASVKRFAVDPVTDNVYFTAVVSGQPTSSFISVLSPKGQHVPIVNGLNEPFDIVLHPKRRYMFWTERYSQHPYIGRAFMDGSVHTELTTDVTNPTGLAIDTEGDILYWADADNGIIKAYSLLMDSTSEILEIPNSLLTDILLDGNILYYLDWNLMGVITKVNLTNTSDNVTIVIPNAGPLSAMALYSPNTHRIKGLEDCAARNGRGDCSDVCLLNRFDHVCACDYGTDTFNNLKTCTDAILCSETVFQGAVSSDCLRHDQEQCDMVCDEGYSQTESKILCENGNWNDIDPCKPDCPDLSPLENGHIRKTRDNKVGSVASFECNVGYKRNGTESRKCEDGLWTNNSPVCDIIECETPEDPPNALLTVSTPNGTTFGKMAVYDCIYGYTLEGPQKRMCAMNGEWEWYTPVCKRIQCSAIDAPGNGSVELTNSFYFESMATFSCDEGYSMEGQNEITCNGDGHWSADTPACQLHVAETSPSISSSSTIINTSTQETAGFRTQSSTTYQTTDSTPQMSTTQQTTDSTAQSSTTQQTIPATPQISQSQQGNAAFLEAGPVLIIAIIFVKHLYERLF